MEPTRLATVSSSSPYAGTGLTTRHLENRDPKDQGKVKNGMIYEHDMVESVASFKPSQKGVDG